jgi:hypothetical protein
LPVARRAGYPGTHDRVSPIAFRLSLFFPFAFRSSSSLLKRLMERAVSTETLGMECTQCGGDAVVKRGETFYCGNCAINIDWQEIIALIQDAHVESAAEDELTKSA